MYCAFFCHCTRRSQNSIMACDIRESIQCVRFAFLFADISFASSLSRSASLLTEKLKLLEYSEMSLSSCAAAWPEGSVCPRLRRSPCLLRKRLADHSVLMLQYQWCSVAQCAAAVLVLRRCWQISPSCCRNLIYVSSCAAAWPGGPACSRLRWSPCLLRKRPADHSVLVLGYQWCSLAQCALAVDIGDKLSSLAYSSKSILTKFLSSAPLLCSPLLQALH